MNCVSVCLKLAEQNRYMLCVRADCAVISPAEFCRRRVTIVIISPAAIDSTQELSVKRLCLNNPIPAEWISKGVTVC